MPNWCEGNIRLRGTAAAIKEFLKNELAVTGYANGLARTVSQTQPEYKDYDDEIEICRPAATDGWLWRSLYIKGTSRNFIDGDEIYLYLGRQQEKTTVCIDDVKAAWGFEPEPYIEKSKKYGIDIKILGFEKGMQFRQTIEIVGGELVEYEEKKFDDWDWECEMPNMGG